MTSTGDLAVEPPIAAPTRLSRAVALFRARDLVAARSACEALIAEARAGSAAPQGALESEASYWAVRCARRQEQPDDALRLLYAGLAAAQRDDLSGMECLLRAELAHVLSTLGQNDDALEQADIAMQRARLEHDPLGEAAAQEALASIHWMTGAWELGLQVYTSALELACACGDLELRVLCMLGLAAAEEGVAELLREGGHIDEAEAGAHRSLQLQRASGVLAGELGDEYLVMYSQLNEGCSLHSMGALEEAKAVMNACLADPSREAVHGNALAQLGQIALDQGDLHTALAHLLHGLKITERLQKPFPMLIALKHLIDVYEALGDPAAALACMRRFHALHVKNSSDKARLLAQAIAVRHETERALATARAERLRADLLERTNADLARVSAVHERAAMQDALTGLANRRRFVLALRDLVPQDGAMRPCALAMIDADHFKQINDRFSHQAGDEVLRRIGELLAANCRRDDLAARYGGEEFVLLTAALARDEMMRLCERIRQAVESEAWSAGMQVTVSIGVAYHDEVDGEPASAAALLALADARLYSAKREGRNRVCDQGRGSAAPSG